MDSIGIALMLAGSVMVYGAKPILSITKNQDNEKKTVILKISGFVIALVGVLRIFEII